MTRYTLFSQAEEMMQLTKTKDGYAKFIQTGALSLYDYGRGFIDLSIEVDNCPGRPPQVRIWFGTIDDGDFGAWVPCASKEDANKLVERIATEVFRDMITFPSDAELNEMLRPYGAYVGYE